MKPVQLRPEDAKVFRPRGRFDAEQRLDPLAVRLRMDEAANPADAFDQVDVLDEVLPLRELLESVMDVPDGGDGLDDASVLHRESELQRLRQHGVLGAEWDDRIFLRHACPFFSSFRAAWGAHGASCASSRSFLKSGCSPMKVIPNRSAISFSMSMAAG
ncbi:hypothetical protein SDC9_136847 [bioreactor metagenome]|uniref:Uncharacterized protein n=1 Tax=bioreactor metagenome TaxID=1076179 RepID=A0A645DKE7_9ZZZZ